MCPATAGMISISVESAVRQRLFAARAPQDRDVSASAAEFGAEGADAVTCAPVRGAQGLVHHCAG